MSEQLFCYNCEDYLRTFYFLSHLTVTAGLYFGVTFLFPILLRPIGLAVPSLQRQSDYLYAMKVSKSGMSYEKFRVPSNIFELKVHNAEKKYFPDVCYAHLCATPKPNISFLEQREVP